MSSLVDCIFGGDEGGDAKGTSRLFDTIIDVPEPKQYPAAAATADKKRKYGGELKDDQGPPSKDKNKKRKGSSSKNEAKTSNHEATTANDKSESSSKTTAVADDKNARTVFVGNLPVHYTRRKLAKLFATCGKIESTRIRSVAVTGIKVAEKGNANLVQKVCSNTQRLDIEAKQSVSGYVVFANQGSVEKAFEMNNSAVEESDVVKELVADTSAVRHIRVDRETAEYDASRSVFVGNLPYTADEESLKLHFGGSATVEGVRIVRDPTTQLAKGFGYVLFRERSDAVNALQRYDQSVYKNRPLRVQVCGKRYKSQHGKGTTTQKSDTQRALLTGSAGALRRVLTKQLKVDQVRQKKRGVKKRKPAASAAGISKRAASQAKAGKRIQKIEKRIAKGMGKTRK